VGTALKIDPKIDHKSLKSTKSVGPDIQKFAGIPSLCLSKKHLETQGRVQKICRWSEQTVSATTRESAANRARTQQPQESMPE